MSAKPTTFTELSDVLLQLLGADTEFYTQIEGHPTIPDGEYKFYGSQLLTLLKSLGVIVVIDGEYTSDALAQSIGGGSVGDYYRVAPGHELGIPSDGGILKRIQS